MTKTKDAKKAADILQALADPSRIRIIDHLVTGSKNVTELAKYLNVEMVNVSHHLGVLRASGLVTDEKYGRFVFYTLNPEFFKINAKKTHINLGWCMIEIPVQ